MTLRRKLLLLVALLWLVLAGIWWARTPPSGGGANWLIIALVLLPLTLVNEVWTILAETVRGWLRRRRAGRDDA